MCGGVVCKCRLPTYVLCGGEDRVAGAHHCYRRSGVILGNVVQPSTDSGWTPGAVPAGPAVWLCHACDQGIISEGSWPLGEKSQL